VDGTLVPTRHRPVTASRKNYRCPANLQVVTVAGRHRLVRPLAQGGFGRVWLAHDERLGADVVVKEVRAPVSADAGEQAKRLIYAEREARNAARLRSHPDIGAVYDVVVEDGRPWMVMELVDGKSLEDRLRQVPLTVGEAMVVAESLLHALDAAHDAGVVHRDVKPAKSCWLPTAG
jgi:serine/threonine protein kinase